MCHLIKCIELILFGKHIWKRAKIKAIRCVCKLVFYSDLPKLRFRKRNSSFGKLDSSFNLLKSSFIFPKSRDR